jgi:hypothetical protein
MFYMMARSAEYNRFININIEATSIAQDLQCTHLLLVLMHTINDCGSKST